MMRKEEKDPIAEWLKTATDEQGRLLIDMAMDTIERKGWMRVYWEHDKPAFCLISLLYLIPILLFILFLLFPNAF